MVFHNRRQLGAVLQPFVFQPTSTESANFLARTSGLTNVRKGLYDALITGLVNDGVWSVFDLLYIFATVDLATARLNLVSSSFAITDIGTGGSFSADNGFTATDGSNFTGTTGYDPTTSATHFARDSGHISTWNLTNNTSSTWVAGGEDGSGAGTCGTQICPKQTSGSMFCRLADFSGGLVAVTDPRGHFLGSRTAATTKPVYQNGSLLFTDTTASVPLTSTHLDVCGYYNGTENGNSANQLAMFSFGGSMTGTQVTNSYNRFRTWMTAVGVP